jgi:hypothetical protein
MTAGAWSGLAVAGAATAGPATHYTPWYVAVAVLVVAAGATILRRRDRRGGGPSGRS